MRTHYFEMEVRRGTDLNVPDTFSLALRVLHQSGIPFALAFPDMTISAIGARLRVFGCSSSDLEIIQDRLENGPADDYVSIRRIKTVPDVKEYEYFLKSTVRPINSIMERKAKFGLKPWTEEKILSVKEQNLTLKNVNRLQVNSVSTGQSFMLHITRHKIEKFSDFKPNSYGLSTKTKIVSLPVFN